MRASNLHLAEPVSVEPVPVQPTPVQAEAAQPMPAEVEQPEATAEVAADAVPQVETAAQEGVQPEVMAAADSTEEEVRKEPNN